MRSSNRTRSPSSTRRTISSSAQPSTRAFSKMGTMLIASPSYITLLIGAATPLDGYIDSCVTDDILVALPTPALPMAQRRRGGEVTFAPRLGTGRLWSGARLGGLAAKSRLNRAIAAFSGSRPNCHRNLTGPAQSVILSGICERHNSHIILSREDE